MTLPHSITMDDLDSLRGEFAGLEGETLIRAVHERFGDRVGVLTSAGADAAITLHAVSKVDPSMKVLFGDTQKHFPQTLQHMELLKQRFGLTNVVSPAIDDRLLEHFDPQGDLNAEDKDLCCGIRKVDPLERYVLGHQIRVLIGGRMGWQTTNRANMPLLEWDVDKNVLMVNPFANLTRAEAEERKAAFPPHPLVAKGYRSIGCEPCTTPGEGREGRKLGKDGKGEECPLNASDGADQNWRARVYLARREMGPAHDDWATP